MQTILVTGSSGQVGTELQKLSRQFPDFRYVFTSRADLDITDFDLVRTFFDLNRVDFCINTAAYTAVDKAESEIDEAFLVNDDAVGNLAEVCQLHEATLLHISTDFVFDGKLNRPYKEDDETQPLNAYGQSKLGGEVRAWEACDRLIVVRSGWIYAKQGRNFLNTMLRLSRERREVKVVNDQVGTPTHAGDLAACLMAMIMDPHLPDKYGTYHFANEGACTWYDFAVASMDLAKVPCRVIPIPTEEYPTPAVRPRYSVLDKTKVKQTFGIEIDEWRISLERIWR